jgi:hypothetical protein
VRLAQEGSADDRLAGRHVRLDVGRPAADRDDVVQRAEEEEYADDRLEAGA